jgi:hypothetical protein
MASRLDIPLAPEHRDFAEFSIAVVAGLALAFTILFIFTVPVAGSLAAARDFVSYWATGHQLIQHGNPYDRDAISALEHSAGLDARAILIMRNPPWALPLVLPLGFLPIRIGAILWTLLLLACMLLSVRLVQQLHGSPPNRIHWLGFAFTPSLICFTMGQTSLLALVGLLLFLRFHLRRPIAAGAALWLCALKPHLFLPFAVALALWIFVSGSYRVLAGFAAALALSSAAASIIAPHAWQDYVRMMRSPAVENDFIPCLAVAARQWFLPQAAWLQYLPAGLCCVWAMIYFWRRRNHWDWIANSSPLMLVSLLFAPYCWLYDQCLAMPAIVHAAYVTRSRHLITLLALMIFTADIQLCFVKVISPLWLWTAPAWFAFYLIARAAAVKQAVLPAKASASP